MLSIACCTREYVKGSPGLCGPALFGTAICRNRVGGDFAFDFGTEEALMVRRHLTLRNT